MKQRFRAPAIFAAWRLRFLWLFPPFDIASIWSIHPASDPCRPFQHFKLTGGHIFKCRIVGHLAKQLRIEVALHGLPALPNVNPAVGIPRLDAGNWNVGQTPDDPATEDVDETAWVANQDNELLYIGATINTPIEGVAIGVAYDDRQWGNYADSDSVALYAAYSLTEDASISVRYDNGTVDFGGGNEDSFDNIALTLGYSIWENVLTRFEMGWESGVGAVGQQAMTGGARPSTAAGSGVYDGHGDSSYFAFNAFYSF